MTGRTLQLRTTGPTETRAIAAAVAVLVEPGDAIALSGELGAGKTCFVQGAAWELGVTGRVTSPTFTLVRTYDARVPIVHCDVYRLNNLQDVLDLGDEVLAPDAVTFVEWGDAITALLPEDRLDVELLLADPDALDGDRLVRVTAFGNWQPRLADLTDACAAWRDGDA